MASNFKILVKKNNKNVHLKLRGDFDGTSADELLIALKENASRGSKIYICTSGLRQVYPFGQRLLQKNLYIMNDQSVSLIFKGKHGAKLGRKGVDSYESTYPSIDLSSCRGVNVNDLYDRELCASE